MAIGSSTGGPRALERLLRQFARPLPVPIYVVQHLPAGFSDALVDKLNRVCSFEVVVAEDGMQAEPGRCYLAPGDRHMLLRPTGVLSATIRIDDGPRVKSCRPSLDLLLRSARLTYDKHVVGVVLTGMGDDGLDGARDLAEAGAPILVQDEASSAVWGMPGAVAKAGYADACIPPDEIATVLRRWAEQSVYQRARYGATETRQAASEGADSWPT